MKRNIISIDEELCNGCGACVKGCHEGALQLIDGKARIISELYCDGLGACIGDCPVGAITIEEREALPYDEISVIKRILPKGESTLTAHIKHLHEHGQTSYVNQAIEYLEKNGVILNTDFMDSSSKQKKKVNEETAAPLPCGCPGSMARSFAAPATVGFKMAKEQTTYSSISQLTQWPVQLHLLNPQSAYFQGADVVLAADCTAYAYGDFHNRFIKNHTIAIACPKLDEGKDIYISKLVSMMEEAEINTLTVVIMEVPCCRGLLHLAQTAAEHSNRKVPIKKVIIGVQGEIIEESWT